VNYTRNAIYSRIVETMKSQFPDAYYTSRLVARPPTFPAVYIHEIDRNRPLRNTQLDFEDVQWESVWEIQVASSKKNVSAAEAYSIMESARAAMSNLYFREFSETNIDTSDSFTIIGRFRRILGGGDTMPPVISA